MELSKWPRLLVKGDQITEQQANEVIVRTTQLWFSGNDPRWRATVQRAFGLAEDPRHGMATWDSIRDTEGALGLLQLEYLSNHRISSAWIGGPHGWCDWDGTIGCSNYNIGKWPEIDEVHNEWVRIAEAFPFLRLDAQLVTDEGEGEVAVAWDVSNGVATVDRTPRSRSYLLPVRDDALVGLLTIGQPGRERGVSLDRLEAAIEQVRATAP